MCDICGCGDTSGVSVGMQTEKKERLHQHAHQHNDVIHMQQSLLTENNQYARQNKQFFTTNNIVALNILSSPGSGKTTFLVNTLNQLKANHALAVIEGDQQTTQDAERIAKTGVEVEQINTGHCCHLDAHMVGHALAKMPVTKNGFLFIENVGNLVCPALFDLGEHYKVVMLSITEGEDKPIKYPDMFAIADVIIVNKIDLLPHLDFDIKRCYRYIKQVNPNAMVFTVSATTQVGFSAWTKWLEKTVFRQKVLSC